MESPWQDVRTFAGCDGMEHTTFEPGVVDAQNQQGPADEREVIPADANRAQLPAGRQVLMFFSVPFNRPDVDETAQLPVTLRAMYDAEEGGQSRASIGVFMEDDHYLIDLLFSGRTLDLSTVAYAASSGVRYLDSAGVSASANSRDILVGRIMDALLTAMVAANLPVEFSSYTPLGDYPRIVGALNDLFARHPAATVAALQTPFEVAGSEDATPFMAASESNPDQTRLSGLGIISTLTQAIYGEPVWIIFDDKTGACQGFKLPTRPTEVEEPQTSSVLVADGDPNESKTVEA